MTPATFDEWAVLPDGPAKWQSIADLITAQWLRRAHEYPEVSRTTLWQEFLHDLNAYLAHKEQSV